MLVRLVVAIPGQIVSERLRPVECWSCWTARPEQNSFQLSRRRASVWSSAPRNCLPAQSVPKNRKKNIKKNGSC